MTIEFNKFNNNYKYALPVGQDTAKNAQKPQPEEEIKEIENKTPSFKGLENETDLLTKNAQNLYGMNITRFSAKDKNIADETNKILLELGYKNYKVTPQQVARIADEMSAVIMPAMNKLEQEAVAARIEDPNGPFADLFAKEIL